MALNPELVAEIVHASLSNSLAGDWQRGGETIEAIDARARERATSPHTFVDWLVLQEFFILLRGINLSTYKRGLIRELSRADLTVVPEDKKRNVHRLLYIDSDEDEADTFFGITKFHAKNGYGITSSIRTSWRAYPPKDPQEFRALLTHVTGSVLHNLSLGNLVTIHESITANHTLASKLVVVKSGRVTITEYDRKYAELASLGVMVVPKPVPSIEEVIRVILGVV